MNKDKIIEVPVLLFSEKRNDGTTPASNNLTDLTESQANVLRSLGQLPESNFNKAPEVDIQIRPFIFRLGDYAAIQLRQDVEDKKQTVLIFATSSGQMTTSIVVDMYYKDLKELIYGIR